MPANGPTRGRAPMLSGARLAALVASAALCLPLSPSRADDSDPELDANYETLSLRELPARPNMTIVDADVYVFEPGPDETNPLYATYPLEPMLRELKPKVESLAREVSHASPDSILVGALLADNPRLATMAYTDCGSAETIFAQVGWTPPGSPTAKACLIVAYVDQVEHAQELAFNLSHEIFHALQNAEHEPLDEGDDWWSEGSADWFAHELVARITTRDDWIQQFLSQQSEKPINKFTYDAQTFFFWGAREFNKRWVMEVGIEGDDRLTTTAGAASVLRPEDWLNWAAYQLDGQITYPDGRSLPVSETTRIGIPSPTCEESGPVVHLGPPLSAQFLTLNIEDPANTGSIEIEAGDAWLRVFGAGSEPLDIQGGSAELTLEGETTLKVAAIVPADQELRIAFTPKGDPDAEPDPFIEACGCQSGESAAAPRDQCVAGNWRLTSGGVVAWMQEVSARMSAAYGVSSSVSGTIDDDVVYRFARDGVFEYRSAGGELHAEGAMGLFAAQMSNLRTPNGGTARYCVRNGQIFIAPKATYGLTGGAVTTQNPNSTTPLGLSVMTGETTVWNYRCSGDSLQMEAVADVPSDMPAELMPPLTVGLTRTD